MSHLAASVAKHDWRLFFLFIIMQTMMCARKNIIIIQYITLNPVFFSPLHIYEQQEIIIPPHITIILFLATLLPPMLHNNIYIYITIHNTSSFYFVQILGKRKTRLFLYSTGNPCFSFKEIMFVFCVEAVEDGVEEQQQPVAYHNNGGVILNRLFPTRVMCKAVKHHCKKKEDF